MTRADPIALVERMFRALVEMVQRLLEPLRAKLGVLLRLQRLQRLLGRRVLRNINAPLLRFGVVQLPQIHALGSEEADLFTGFGQGVRRQGGAEAGEDQEGLSEHGGGSVVVKDGWEPWKVV